MFFGRAARFALREKSFAELFLSGSAPSVQWSPTSSSLCFTERTVESEHPYPFDVRAVEKVEIKGAPFLMLYFDEKTRLSRAGGAYVELFADEALTESLLVLRASSALPGVSEKPLLVKGDCVFVKLSVPPPPPEGRTESVEDEWGYILTAKAPVSDAAAKELRRQLMAEPGKRKFTEEACREALR